MIASITVGFLCAMLCIGSVALGQSTSKKQSQQPKPTPPDAALNAYISRVREENAVDT